MAGEQQGDWQARKAAGVFYTPAQIVEYILAGTLANHDVLANPQPRVLDPACGSGNFLVAAYDLLLAKFTASLPALRQKYAKRQYAVNTGGQSYWLDGREYWQQDRLHEHIMRYCLYGADLDAAAVAAAQQRLAAKQPAVPLNTAAMNLLVGDSLIKWEDRSLVPDSCQAQADPRLAAFWTQKYEYVVGNPPYISFGLNRVGKATAEQAQYLRTHYPHSAQYKLSYYALFLERGIAALQPGGYLGYITPDSYLLGRYYSKIRAYILANCHIRELALVNARVFGRVVVGIPAITLLQKRNPQQRPAAELVTVKHIKTAAGEAAGYQYPQDYFAKQVYNRFRLFFSAKDKAIVDKLDAVAGRLGDVAKIRTGMRALTAQRDIKSKNKQGDSWQPGLVSSAQVLPFSICYQGDWLDVNPAKLNKGGWEQAVIAGPKIFLRQTGDKLIAAIDQDGYYHLNNIHSVVSCQGRLSLEYLTALLNSRLLNFYYQAVTLEKGRSMAQVDIEMVEKLPLVIDCQRESSLVRLAAQLAGENPGDGASSPVYQELNALVYEIYSLSAQERLYIEASFQKKSGSKAAGNNC